MESKMTLKELSYLAIADLAIKVSKQIFSKYPNVSDRFDNVYPIPRGGYIFGIYLSEALGLPICLNSQNITSRTLIVDDICDSGNTLSKYPNNEKAVAITRESTKIIPTYFGEICSEWIKFPDEKNNDIDTELTRVLEFLETGAYTSLQNTSKALLQSIKSILKSIETYLK